MACLLAATVSAAVLPALGQSAIPPASLGLADALGAALSRNVGALLQRQEVVSSESRVLLNQGVFDPALTGSAGRNADRRSLRQDQTDGYAGIGLFGIDRQVLTTSSYQLGFDRILMSGVGIATSAGVTGTDDSLARLAGTPNQTVGQIALSVRVPLLRNAGRETVGAALDAANAELLAARLDLQQVTAQGLFETTAAYWEYVARTRRLDVARTSEQRALDLVGELRRLIAADQIPAAEIELALATVAERRVLRISAEQSLSESRRALARTIGLSPAESLSLPPPRDDFPGYDGRPVDYTTEIDRLLQQALEARTDLQAIVRREEAARFRVGAARNNLRPQLDLNFRLASSGLTEGRPISDLNGAFLDRRSGPSAGAAVSLRWPYNNATARGNLLGQSALLDAQSIRFRDLQASIASGLSLQVDALRRSALQLQEVDEAVRRFAITLRNEETKRQLGTSTLIDVINVQDRLINAALLQVQQRQSYATAIAALRFEIGQIVRATDDAFEVRLGDLLNNDFALRKD